MSESDRAFCDDGACVFVKASERCARCGRSARELQAETRVLRETSERLTVPGDRENARCDEGPFVKLDALCECGSTYGEHFFIDHACPTRVGYFASRVEVLPFDAVWSSDSRDINSSFPPIAEKRAPLQGERKGGRWVEPPGTIAWEEHLAAFEAYAAIFGREQSAERIAERGGFGWREVCELLGHEPTTWRER